MQDIITRLLALIEQSGLDDKQILSEIGLSPKSTLIADWRRKKSNNPSSTTIIKFAKFFHVSTDYILTGKINYDTISNDEKDWILLYRELTARDSRLFKEGKSYIEGLLKGYEIYDESDAKEP